MVGRSGDEEGEKGKRIHMSLEWIQTDGAMKGGESTATILHALIIKREN